MDEQIEIQNQINNPTPPAQSEAKPSHHTVPAVALREGRVTPWVALVIIATIAATVGYLVWAKAHEAWPFDYDGPWSEIKRGSGGEFAGWKTYRNEEYGFEVKHPPSVAVGELSENSVLGIFDAPVKGILIGGWVFVPLNDAGLERKAVQYYERYEKFVGNPIWTETGGLSCDSIPIENSSVQVRVVYCHGDGGPAIHTLISHEDRKLYVDGYSSGYPSRPITTIRMDKEDFLISLSTFKFIEPSP